MARHFWVRRTAFKEERVTMVRSRPRVSGGRLMRGMVRGREEEEE
jgi:hypothetical protein